MKLMFADSDCCDSSIRGVLITRTQEILEIEVRQFHWRRFRDHTYSVDALPKLSSRLFNINIVTNNNKSSNDMKLLR
jgi:hypothetical protein